MVQEIISDLRLLQQKALSGEKPDLCTVLSGYQIDITSTTTYNLQAVCSTNITIKTIDLAVDEVTISSSFDPIKFKVLGQGTNIVNAQSTTIILTQTGTNSTATITVTAGGEVK